MNAYRLIALPASVFVLCVAIAVALQYGSIAMTWQEIGQAFVEDMSVGDMSMDNTGQRYRNSMILWEIRLPRILMSALVGAALAISGAVMQGLFRNPLADPGLIGVSSGAALGAGLAIVFGNLYFVSVPQWLIPLCAFGFGLLVTAIVYLIAAKDKNTSVATLLLAGIAIQALAGASMGLLNYLADDQQLRDITFWSLGSFGDSSWRSLQGVALCLIPGIICLICCAKYLNALLLGEAEAQHLGVNVERFKRYCIVLVSLVVGVSVASVGVIGFVGLVVPHMIRLAFGSDHRFLLPASASLGALVLVIADTFARNVISPAELPIGIITALVGCPFFLFLIIKQRNLSSF